MKAILFISLALLASCVEEPTTETETSANTTTPTSTTPTTTTPEVDPDAIPEGCVTKDYCPDDFPLTFNGQAERIKKQINWNNEQSGNGVAIYVMDERFDYNHPFFSNKAIKTRKVESELLTEVIDTEIYPVKISLTYETNLNYIYTNYTQKILTIHNLEKAYYSHTILDTLTCLNFYSQDTNTYTYPQALLDDSSIENRAIDIDSCIERDIGIPIKLIRARLLAQRKYNYTDVIELPAQTNSESNNNAYHKHGQMVATALKTIAPNLELKAMSFAVPYSTHTDFSLLKAPIASRSNGSVIYNSNDITCSILNAKTYENYIQNNLLELYGIYPTFKVELLLLKNKLLQIKSLQEIFESIIYNDTIYIQAAGNERKNIEEVIEFKSQLCTDEIVNNVLFVGAVDERNVLRGYSSKAGNLFSNSYLVAPADQHILSQINNDTGLIEERVPTETDGGTSFATPLVAATAALIKERQPRLTGAQIKQVLLRSADDLGEIGVDKVYGYGLLNVGNALLLADKVAQTGEY